MKNKAHEDPKILKEVRTFLKELNESQDEPLETLPPEKARGVLEDAQESENVDYSGIQEQSVELDWQGHRFTTYVVKPKAVKQEVPVFMFFHGGGWVLGDYPTHKRLVRDLVVQSGAACVFPDYTRSPEATYPVAINQGYLATKWIVENGKDYGIDGTRLAVAGNSVGGNMATVVALMAQEEKEFFIRLQLLLWPVTDANFTRESYKKYAEDRFLTTSLMKWMWDNYAPNQKTRKEIYAAPMQASPEQLASLPPAVIQLAENDILHDEGLAYGRKLNEAGVDTTIQCYNGLIHDYGLLNALASVPAVKEAITSAAASIKKFLS